LLHVVRVLSCMGPHPNGESEEMALTATVAVQITEYTYSLDPMSSSSSGLAVTSRVEVGNWPHRWG
jgi:hypothetical protein